MAKRRAEIRKRLFVTALVLVIHFAMGLMPTQGQIGEMMSTVGTARRDGAGRQWVYVVWQATSPEFVANRYFVVYAKPGDAAAGSPYQRKAVVFQQARPEVLQPLLQRATNLGDDLVQLDNRLTAVFEELITRDTVTTAEKLSIVLQAASAEPEQYENLLNLAQLHPSVSLCLGTAWTAEVPAGVHTFEIRELDMSTQQERAVVGRVTVDTANPAVLPAPGAPFVFSETSPQGHLNLKLRWSTPDELQRLSLMSYGFNVYRMTKAFAMGGGYHLTPPTQAVLTNLAANSTEVRRVNGLPVLPEEDLSPAQVVDPSDRETYFFADDKQRVSGVVTNTFEDGEQFYYFITARDILGRDGLVSPGGLGTACDRYPPLIPDEVEARYDYGYAGLQRQQRYKVVWKQNTNSGPQGQMRYLIYRWTNTVDIPLSTPNPATSLIGTVDHDDGQEYNEFTDTGVTLPPQPNQTIKAAQAFWYTVRAVELTACGENISGNSGPAQAVLRDWAAPAGPEVFVVTACEWPVVIRSKGSEVTSYKTPTLATDLVEFRFKAVRTNESIRWIEFTATDLSNRFNQPLGRHYFSSNSVTTTPFVLPRALGNLNLTVVARAGTFAGVESELSRTTLNFLDAGSGAQLNFDVLLTNYNDRPCPSHDPNPSVAGGRIRPITVAILIPAAGTLPFPREYRLYRSIDGGRKTLFKQGEIPAPPNSPEEIEIPDEDLPVNAGEVCYYVQFLDSNGNPSESSLPLAVSRGQYEDWKRGVQSGSLALGCIKTAGHVPMPVPRLLPIRAGTNSAGAPTMKISWFCPPHGIDHFNVWISAPGLADTIGDRLSVNQAQPIVNKVPPGNARPLPFKLFKTPSIGATFGDGAEFFVEANIEAGKNYWVHVSAVANDAVDGRESNSQSFTWNQPAVPGLQVGTAVPWPARALPAVNEPFNDGIFAYRITSCINRVGIRIGETIVTNISSATHEPLNFCTNLVDPIFKFYTSSTNDPASYLYTDKSSGNSILPVVLYRTQVANSRYVTVSSNVVQVSPLMENIAYNVREANLQPQPPYSAFAYIIDPFIAVIPDQAETNLFADSPPPNGRNGIYLLDTTPLLAGAAYQYFLVRFGSDGEMEQVIPTNIIDLEVTP